MKGVGRLELKVLTVISVQNGDAYGASIQRDIENRFGELPALGAIYRALRRMENKELVTSFEGKATAIRGGRKKRLYRLQPDGQRVLDEAASRKAA